MVMANPTTFPKGKVTFLLPGAAGDIEVASTALASTQGNKVIVICHPHPLYGGTMENKVATTLVRTFSELGFNTVRFNFRGVGASTGEHDAGIGEADDLLTVFDWISRVLPKVELWLAGFSFGAYVAYRVATSSQYQNKIKQLLLIAPPIQYPEFNILPAPTMPWTIVQGEEDEVVVPQAVFAWLDGITPPARLFRMPTASHFFHGKLVDLKHLLTEAFR